MAGLERLEEDFHIVRKSHPGSQAASRPGTASSLSSQVARSEALSAGKDLLNGRQSAVDRLAVSHGSIGRGAMGAPSAGNSISVASASGSNVDDQRLQRLESRTTEIREEASATLAAGLRQMRQDVSKQLDSMRQELSGYQDFPSLRADLEVKSAQQQVSLSEVQAQFEQVRLQVADFRSELAALRERQELQASSLQSDLRRDLDALQLTQAQATREIRLEQQQAADRHSEMDRKSLLGAQEELDQLRASLAAQLRAQVQDDVVQQVDKALQSKNWEKPHKDQAAREENSFKLIELANCVDELVTQVQELKQDQYAECTLLRSRIEAQVQDHQIQMARLDSFEMQQREEQSRLNTESSAHKARLQSLELRLSGASLEKVTAQASSAHKAQELIEQRLTRLEAKAAADAGISDASILTGTSLSNQDRATTAPGSPSASGRPSNQGSVGSLEAQGGQGLARMVGAMDAELRVELSSRLRVLAAEMKGEIMADVGAKFASVESASSALEAKVSAELDEVMKDLATCFETIQKAQVVPRLKSLEEQARRSNLVLGALQEERQRLSALSTEAAESDIDGSSDMRGSSTLLFKQQLSERGRIAELEQQGLGSEQADRSFIQPHLRDRLKGLVSAISETLGQVQPDAPYHQDGTEISSVSVTTGSSGRGNTCGSGPRTILEQASAISRSRSVAAPAPGSRHFSASIPAASEGCNPSQSSTARPISPHRTRTQSPGMPPQAIDETSVPVTGQRATSPSRMQSCSCQSAQRTQAAPQNVRQMQAHQQQQQQQPQQTQQDRQKQASRQPAVSAQRQPARQPGAPMVVRSGGQEGSMQSARPSNPAAQGWFSPTSGVAPGSVRQRQQQGAHHSAPSSGGPTPVHGAYASRSPTLGARPANAVFRAPGVRS